MVQSGSGTAFSGRGRSGSFVVKCGAFKDIWDHFSCYLVHVTIICVALNQCIHLFIWMRCNIRSTAPRLVSKAFKLQDLFLMTGHEQLNVNLLFCDMFCKVLSMWTFCSVIGASSSVSMSFRHVFCCSICEINIICDSTWKGHYI